MRIHIDEWPNLFSFLPCLFLLDIPKQDFWQPTPALLPGKSRGQRSLVGYSPWGCKESDKTEWLDFKQDLDTKKNWDYLLNS